MHFVSLKDLVNPIATKILCYKPAIIVMYDEQLQFESNEENQSKIKSKKTGKYTIALKLIITLN